MSANDDILKALLDRGDYLAGFSDEEISVVLRILERAQNEILGKLATTKGPGTRAWLADVKSDIDAIYAEAAERVGKVLTSDLKGLAKTEAAWLNEEFQKVAVGVSFTAPAPGTLWATIAALPAVDGSTLAQLTEALGLSGSVRLTEAIQTGMADGETIEQLTRRIRGEVVKRASWKMIDGKRRYVPGVYRDGVFETTTREAEILARTAVAHVSNQAREAYYAKNADLIKGYEYVATLDGDTCIICGAIDGKVYAPDEARPEVPQHMRCRCLYAPVTKSWRELGYDRDELPDSTRASMDGQVPENQTFEDRLKKMRPERQDAILGPTRGRLYREGMPLTDMTAEGKIIPLAQLGKRRRSAA